MTKSLGSLSLKKSSRKKYILLTTLTLLVVILIAGGLAVFLNKKEADKNLENSANPDTNMVRNSEKGLPGSDYATGNTADSTSTKPQADSDSPPPPESDKPAIEISSFSQNGDIIEIKAALLNISSAGRCIFTFSKDGAKSVVKEVSSNGKVCAMSAKSTEFSKLDIWTLTIAFYNGSKKIVDTTLNVTVN